jgi:hypothetical protein
MSKASGQHLPVPLQNREGQRRSLRVAQADSRREQVELGHFAREPVVAAVHVAGRQVRYGHTGRELRL